MRAAPDNIGPTDPRYAELNRRGFNKRFEGKPDYIRLVGSMQDVINAVQLAVKSGLRLAVRSGGHCLDGFVSDPDVRVVIDMSPMASVAWDPAMKAFAIESGTTLGEVHRKLFLGWGVVLPAGQSPDIGIGGHVLGSSFGFIHRLHGLACDHLYAVEVVVVDDVGKAKSVVATREPTDPNRELWWAHTGGGGGNFGVVTRYWFRSHGADGSDPAKALPKAPESVVTLKASWKWSDIVEGTFIALLRNYGEWAERNAGADSKYAAMFSVILAPPRMPDATIDLRMMSIAGASAETQLDEHLAAVVAGVNVANTRNVDRISWLAFAVNPWPDLFAIGPGGTSASQARLKAKDALRRKGYMDWQLAVMFRELTRADLNVYGGVGLATYGGRVNSVAPDATAASQRSAVLVTSYSAAWGNPADEERCLAWVREFYREIFTETGGVPVPNESNEGALITHPDADMADAKWNTSGVPWHEMYYQGNYARLQRVKATWDPGNVFRHALSIALPG